MRQTLNAEKRTEKTLSALRALRNGGRLPGVIYGSKLDAVSIHVSTKDVRRQLQKGKTELIDLNIEGVGTYPVMLTEIQREPLSGKLLHADFHQIKMDEAARMKVSVDYRGTAPGTKAGGILQMQETHVEVEGMPDRIPPFIEADISGLQVGDKLMVSDLTIPADLRMVSAPDMLLASIIVPRGMKEDEDSAAEAAAVPATAKEVQQTDND